MAYERLKLTYFHIVIHFRPSGAGDAVNMNVTKDVNMFNVWSSNFLTIVISRILTVFLQIAVITSKYCIFLSSVPP